MKQKILQAVCAVLVCAGANAQVNTGSTGSDGALDLTNNTVINMADHPNGIYNYTYVNIPTNVTVQFIPNAANSPVIWLVQSNVTINGTVDVSGKPAIGGNADPLHYLGGTAGPGGYAGGEGGAFATSGQEPGGGSAVFDSNWTPTQANGPSTYCNKFLIPLLGGSGGGGTGYSWPTGGGGGGGAILIAASGQINLDVNGVINAKGGGNSGSGGAVRLVTTQFSGSGVIRADGSYGNTGRIRVDSYFNTFGGLMYGTYSLGSQFIIIPVAGQLPQLTVTGVGGVSVSAPPTGGLTTPDAVLSPQQNNPIPVVVSCVNLPLNTLITVSVKPANSPAISATGYNTTGTLSASTATIPIVMPRGGGLIYATATTSN